MSILCVRLVGDLYCGIVWEYFMSVMVMMMLSIS